MHHCQKHCQTLGADQCCIPPPILTVHRNISFTQYPLNLVNISISSRCNESLNHLLIRQHSFSPTISITNSFWMESFGSMEWNSFHGIFHGIRKWNSGPECRFRWKKNKEKKKKARRLQIQRKESAQCKKWKTAIAARYVLIKNSQESCVRRRRVVSLQCGPVNMAVFNLLYILSSAVYQW